MPGMYAETVGHEGATQLVLLHGGIGTGRYHWSKLVRPLSERFFVHLPDMPGHGHTPLPEDGAYTREVLVDAVAGYLEKVGPPAHVAAFSMGGHACLALAQDRPELFASLALVGVSVRDHAGLQEWRERFDPDRLEREFPLWARALSKMHAPLGNAESWRDVCRRDSAGVDVTVDLDALRGLACPVLLIRGDRDPAVNPDHYAELRGALPQADEFVVPAGAHDVQLTRHQLVLAVLRDFLHRVGI
jgi:3-oxoadipate enol-lactonase